MTRTIVRLSLCCAAALLPLFASGREAVADVLVELSNGDQVAGTFLPSSEVETFLVRVPQGSTLSASAAGKQKKGAGPKVTMRLLDPNGTPVVTNALAPTPTGAKLKGYVVPESGVYALELTGDALGDYAFKVKWKPPTSAKATVDFELAATSQITIHAARDSVALFRIAAYPGESGLPRLIDVRATDGSYAHTFDPPPSPTAPAHAQFDVRLSGDVDDYVVTVSETPGTVGLALFTAKLKPPKLKPRRADLTSSVLGADPRSNFVEGRVIGPEGGVVSAESFENDPLTGAAVSVSPGALSSPTAIVIGPAEEIDDGGDAEPMGPAVSFGPEGTEFAQDATVTLPYDAEAAGEDAEGLLVVTEDGDGEVSTVPEDTYDVDPATGTVSFPTSHFSVYQVFGPRRPRRSDLNGDGIDDLAIPAPTAGNFRGTVRVVYGGPDLASRSSSDADVSIFGNGGTEAYFGYLMALGDLDDDGETDLAVASYGFSDYYFGKIHVFKGGAGFDPQEASDADFVFSTGPVDTGAFTSLAIGDVNGDGKPDLVVGASTVGGAVADDGAVWVVAGGAGFHSASTGDASVIRISGGIADLRFGDAIAIGDVIGDANADIVIGAPRALSSGNGSPGYVGVVPGGPSLASQDAADLKIVLSGTLLREEFGRSIAVADFDGDGDGDIAVGAPERTAPSPGLAAGAVHIFRGPIDTAPGTTTELIVGTAALGSGGKGSEGDIGWSLRVGNVVGDPTRDLIVGCPLTSPVTGPGLAAGALLVLRGGAAFPSDVRIETGSEVFAHFGCPVLACADVDGDGRLDVIAAEPDADEGAGRAVIRTGPSLAGPTIVITGRAAESLGGPFCR